MEDYQKLLERVETLESFNKERLEKELSSLKEEMWHLKKGVNSSLDNIQGSFGWRKTTRKLPNWKNEHEFVEMYAHVYVLDDGYRKILPPFVTVDVRGNREVLHKEYKETWDGKSRLRCYMVSRLVLPGYYKLEDLTTNNSKNFTMKELFGKTYSELVSHMQEHNYNCVRGEIYSLNFYEL